LQINNGSFYLVWQFYLRGHMPKIKHSIPRKNENAGYLTRIFMYMPSSFT